MDDVMPSFDIKIRGFDKNDVTDIDDDYCIVNLYEIKDTNLIPRMAIELQGGEHFGNLDREKCDARKSQICKEKGITLLEIPNSFAKSYETIKELILISCGQQIEQLELF